VNRRDSLTCCVVIVALSVAVAFSTVRSGYAAPTTGGPEDYLLLVNGNRANQLTPAQLTVYQESPYDGLAVRFLTQYDTAPPPTAEEMTATLSRLKQSGDKDYWPWVSLNRMVGKDPESDSSYAHDPYFARTRGMDLENTTGAKRDFLQLWRNTLRAAKQSKAPGMIVDMELYVNYKAYEPTALAQQIGKSVDLTIAMLQAFGVELADAAAQEFPNAQLWFFFTDLGELGWKTEGGVKYYPTPGYIALGLLDRIREKHYGLRVISGGEVSLGYCTFSVEHLQRRMETRSKDFSPHLEKYGDALALGGTMILWPNRAAKTDFVGAGTCAKSDAATVEEQEPYLELLFKTYRYNWIYGTHNSGYDPFNAGTAARFNAVIRKAKAAAGRSNGLH